ncbi:hypothetical protein PRUPE_2G124400 [Prunus persica]|uniref:Uncharacterized protein n=1 Tax=Prunus persica TaxID=3760 RepID=A0A251QF10_PRUPE|nr:hypothetical protein PRUPE_2G124400 [Prunus persica]
MVVAQKVKEAKITEQDSLLLKYLLITSILHCWGWQDNADQRCWESLCLWKELKMVL